MAPQGILGAVVPGGREPEFENKALTAARRGRAGRGGLGATGNRGRGVPSEGTKACGEPPGSGVATAPAPGKAGPGLQPPAPLLREAEGVGAEPAPGLSFGRRAAPPACVGLRDPRTAEIRF